MNLLHPAVFLFGAGATRGAFPKQVIPPPVDSDFFEIALHIKGHGTQMLAKKVLHDVWSLYGKTYGVGLEYYYRDIETREKISSFAKAANKPKDWQRRRSDLDELIRRVIIHTTCKEEDGHYHPMTSVPHQRILATLDPRDTIVTFNYDLVIEHSFGNASLWTPRNGYLNGIPGITGAWSKAWFKKRGIDTDKKSELPILKLHGSVNWDQYSNGGLTLKNRPLMLRKKEKKVIPESVSILAPGWNKAIDKNPYREFWREARLDLENCPSIVILGYSMPETDLLAKALFSEIVRHRAVKKNGYIRQLHLCDPVDSVKNRFIELFRPALSSNSKIFRYKDIEEFSKACLSSQE